LCGVLSCASLVCMGIRRGRWWGFSSPRLWEKFNKERLFFSFEWKKTNFTTFGPFRKILENSPSDHPLNPLDAHVYTYYAFLYLRLNLII